MQRTEWQAGRLLGRGHTLLFGSGIEQFALALVSCSQGGLAWLEAQAVCTVMITAGHDCDRHRGGGWMPRVRLLFRHMHMATTLAILHVPLCRDNICLLPVTPLPGPSTCAQVQTDHTRSKVHMYV